MSASPAATSIDAYIAAFPPATREVLEQVRAIAHAAAPGATERISYGMPTIDLDGRPIVHFAGYARHVGVYPVPASIRARPDVVAGYRTGKGSIQFPLDKPLPADLVRRIVEARIAEQGAGPDRGVRAARGARSR